MDALFEALVGYGPVGISVGLVVILLRGELSKMFRGGTSDTELLISTMRELRESVEKQTEQFKHNNNLFQDVLEETRGVRHGISQLLVESVRGKGPG